MGMLSYEKHIVSDYFLFKTAKTLRNAINFA